MAFKRFRRKDRRKAADRPHILLTPTVISYGVRFVRDAELERGTRVSMHVDEEGYRLGLEFRRDATQPDSFRLTWPPSMDGRRNGSGVTSSITALVRRFAWVRRIAECKDVEARRFEPEFDGRLWIIHLGPTFEHEDSRDGDTIPADATGIYRFVRAATGEVVYIGRGQIRQRLRAPERAAWDFDLVQYSLLDAPREQNRWERHWIEQFREEHGRLPEYNRV